MDLKMTKYEEDFKINRRDYQTSDKNRHHFILSKMIKQNEKMNSVHSLKKEEPMSKGDGMRNLISLINQVQTVIDRNLNTPEKKNIEQQQKSIKNNMPRDSDVETAVATMEVSKDSDELFDKFKLICTKSNSSDKDRKIKDSKPAKNNNIDDTSLADLIGNKINEFNNNDDDPKTNPTPKSKHTIKINTPIQSVNDANEVKIYPAMARYDKNDSIKTLKEKKPFVRTIQSSRDPTRVYKTVSFIESKNRYVTPLRIKIPDDAEATPSKTIATVTDDPDKARAKVIDSRAIRPRYNITYKRKEVKKTLEKENPLTDNFLDTKAAKYQPCDKYLKSCYEAWVDTSLTAVSKHDSAVKAKVWESYKRSLERMESCRDVYQNYSDEKYTGKIKIRTKETR